ncbi:pyroglutamyl-peptidase I [Corynebacterium casei]|uniref:pyroglutamyl-peptidase I n=1 Tax=Corynebacterium casei TaxID=160386 RepID=UPI003F938BC7
MVRTILVTAFDAFGGEDINPSLEIARRLPHNIGDTHIITSEIPTEFALAAKVARQNIDKHMPDAVVCLGQAGGRHAITPERVAINLIDAPIADNAGALLVDAPINPAGPTAYFATLPVKSMVQAIRAHNIPAELSTTAGTFVCNFLMYSVLDYLASSDLDILAGFIHVPYIPEQHQQPAVPLDDLVAGITAALGALIADEPDEPTGDSLLGSLH